MSEYPCKTCTRVKDTKNCENKTCREWQQWFLDRQKTMCENLRRAEGRAEFVSTCEVPDEIPRGFFRCENMCIEQCYIRNKDEAEEEWNRREKDGCD